MTDAEMEAWANAHFEPTNLEEMILQEDQWILYQVTDSSDLPAIAGPSIPSALCNTDTTTPICTVSSTNATSPNVSDDTFNLEMQQCASFFVAWNATGFITPSSKEGQRIVSSPYMDVTISSDVRLLFQCYLQPQKKYRVIDLDATFQAFHLYRCLAAWYHILCTCRFTKVLHESSLELWMNKHDAYSMECLWDSMSSLANVHYRNRDSTDTHEKRDHGVGGLAFIERIGVAVTRMSDVLRVHVPHLFMMHPESMELAIPHFKEFLAYNLSKGPDGNTFGTLAMQRLYTNFGKHIKMLPIPFNLQATSNEMNSWPEPGVPPLFRMVTKEAALYIDRYLLHRPISMAIDLMKDFGLDHQTIQRQVPLLISLRQLFASI